MCTTRTSCITHINFPIKIVSHIFERWGVDQWCLNKEHGATEKIKGLIFWHLKVFLLMMIHMVCMSLPCGLYTNFLNCYQTANYYWILYFKVSKEASWSIVTIYLWLFYTKFALRVSRIYNAEFGVVEISDLIFFYFFYGGFYIIIY